MSDAAKPGSNKIEARRKAFVQAYISNGMNGTQAAIAAGYSAKGADVAAIRLLGNARTKSLIAELTAPAAKLAGLSVERTLQEVARLAYFDPRALYRDDGNLKRPDEWDDDTAAAVSSLEINEEFDGAGADRKLEGYTKKIKLWDKNSALEKAMKHLGLFEKDNSQLSRPVAINMVFE